MFSHRPPATALAALVALSMILGAAVLADAPAPQQATLLLRILAFDRKLAARAAGSVTVAIIYKEGTARSETAMSQLAAALEEAARKNTVAGLPVKVARVPFSAHLEADLQGASAAYLCPGLEDSLSAIVRATQARKALTFSSSEEYLAEGTSIALVTRETKLAIVVNLPNSRGEGADLDSNLLRIAEVIR